MSTEIIENDNGEWVYFADSIANSETTDISDYESIDEMPEEMQDTTAEDCGQYGGGQFFCENCGVWHSKQDKSEDTLLCALRQREISAPLNAQWWAVELISKQIIAKQNYADKKASADWLNEQPKQELGKTEVFPCPEKCPVDCRGQCPTAGIKRPCPEDFGMIDKFGF